VRAKNHVSLSLKLSFLRTTAEFSQEEAASISRYPRFGSASFFPNIIRFVEDYTMGSKNISLLNCGTGRKSALHLVDFMSRVFTPEVGLLERVFFASVPTAA
jgi:hypothetical protein